MTKNVTLRLEEATLQKARHEAVQQNTSLSGWLSDLIVQAVAKRSHHVAVKRRTLKAMEKTFNLGGKPLSRDEIYAERIR